MTYTEIDELLGKTSCLSAAKPSNLKSESNRERRDVNAGTNDIKALQTTINDHRVMIEYLINNTINQTVLTTTVYNHSRMAPSFSSWRDLVDILLITLLSILIIYLIICRTGFSKCDKVLICLFQPVLNRLQRQQPHQHQIAQHINQDQHKGVNLTKTSTVPSPSAPIIPIDQQLNSLSTIANRIIPSNNPFTH